MLMKKLQMMMVIKCDNPKYDANKTDKNETEVVIPLKHLSNF